MLLRRKSEIGRFYFQRLFTAFLLIAIIPLALCIMIILYINYAMSVESYEINLENTLKESQVKLDQSLEEYENVLDNIAHNPFIKEALINQEGNSSAEGESILSSLMTGREGKIQIRVIDADSSKTLGSTESINIYDSTVYKEWGIFHLIRRNKDSMVLFPNVLNTASGKNISLSLGRAIQDDRENIIGYAIIDILRSTLIKELSLGDIESHVVLTGEKNIVFLDTSSLIQEGKVLPEELLGAKGSETWELIKDEGKAHYKSALGASSYGYSIYVYIDTSDFYVSMKLIITISCIAMFIVTLISMAAAYFLAKRMYNPVDVLVKAMEKIAQGDMNLRLKEDNRQTYEMSLLTRGFNRMIDEINRLISKVVEQSSLQKTAEIKALQAQINPHFLYNMLNEIKALAKLNRNSEISKFVVYLGNLLRRSITYNEAFISVKEEMDFAGDYLELQKIRYEDSFQVQMDIQKDIMEARIPNLIIQPLVENSIIHGFAEKNGENIIIIKGFKTSDNKVVFEIYDNGVGLEDGYIEYVNNFSEESEIYKGVGVINVQKRLKLIYGKDYGIHLESEKGNYTRITVTLPYRKEDDIRLSRGDKA
ncbi:sensor histidine kinase [Clostridium polynesiense]|uniref:sensor histidine kinase n=1 Tax=Clostridium polynesiense TaxID=1325933 RepID=UPI00058C55A3|nr:sensor histidine kinase [Clostridium polynesiense]